MMDIWGLEKSGWHKLVDLVLAEHEWEREERRRPLSPLLAGYWIEPSGVEHEFSGGSEHHYWVKANAAEIAQKLGLGVALDDPYALERKMMWAGWVQGRITLGYIAARGENERVIRSFLQNRAIEIAPEDLDKVKVSVNHRAGNLVEWL